MHAVAGDARELVQSRERGIDLQTLAEALGRLSSMPAASLEPAWSCIIVAHLAVGRPRQARAHENSRR